MEKIKLSSNEKKVLRSISMKDRKPETMSKSGFYTAVRSLERHGLVHAMYEEGNGVVDARLTDEGVTYLSENPSLRNPVDWQIVAISTAIGVLISIIALFVACMK